MPRLARPALRWTALVGLWAVVGAVLWLTAVQLFLLALNPFCRLARPGLARGEVRRVDRNPDSQITDFVTVRHGDAERVLDLPKTEAAALRPEDEVWLLEAWYSDGLRPTAFLLTPQRVLLEYPLLLLVPATWGLWRVRKAKREADAAPPPPVRRVFTDDFHLRAQRFAKLPAPQDAPAAGSGPGPGPDPEAGPRPDPS